MRVFDLVMVVAGPSGATILTDIEADVAQIKAPAGDDCRHTGPRVGADSEPEDASGVWAGLMLRRMCSG